jgi:putative serine protease PepD
MSTPIMEQPPTGPGNGRLAPPTPPDGPRGRSATRAARAALVAVALFAALLGAGAVTAVLAATGALDGSTKSTSVVEPVATASGGTSTANLNPRALYASSAAGVVDITASGVSSGGDQGGGGGGPFGPSGPSGQSQTTAAGSGSVIDGQGRILTAAHVVQGASSIKVNFQDGTTRTARVLGADQSTDIALLKVDPSGLTLHPLALGSSKGLAVGDALAVIGDPFQYSRSLSTGVVSGLDRTIGATNGFSIAHAIQTDASLNPGNSGGPVLDAKGRLVGIADQIATGGSSAQTSSGVGFAVPIDIVKSELSQLESGAQVSHAYLGIETGNSTDGNGALVGSVQGGGPAAAAGMRSGDVVTAFDGSPVHGSNDLVAAITSHRPGDKVNLTVRRGSSSINITATLATQPRQATSG